MKKLLSIFILFALIITSLTACIETKDGTVTVVIGTQTPAEYTLDFKTEEIENGLLSVLDLLEIDYDISNGFLNGVGELHPEAPEYIYIYTSVEADVDVSDWAQSMEYGGKTLVGTGFGASEMHITDGAFIYIGTIVYDY